MVDNPDNEEEANNPSGKVPVVAGEGMAGSRVYADWLMTPAMITMVHDRSAEDGIKRGAASACVKDWRVFRSYVYGSRFYERDAMRRERGAGTSAEEKMQTSRGEKNTPIEEKARGKRYEGMC